MIEYIIKECLVFFFYFAIIYNIIFSVILSKRIKKKKRKNKKRKGGGIYNFIKGFFLILQCIISLGFVCNKKWFKDINENDITHDSAYPASSISVDMVLDKINDFV